MTEQNRVDKLVDDLVRLGAHGEWDPPVQQENLDWFAPYGYLRQQYRKDALVVKRLTELVQAGANLKDKAYIIANINNCALLEAAFKFGADPNMPGRSGLIPIDRALNRNRGGIAELIIGHPDFNFDQKGRNNQNVVFMTIDAGKYKIANKIITIKPEFILERDNDNSTIMLAVARQVAFKPKLTPNIIKFINACLNYANEQNYDFSINEINKRGDSILSRSPKVAEYITEQKVLDLNQKLSKKEDTTKKIFKL
jgi:hypothetical protein